MATNLGFQQTPNYTKGRGAYNNAADIIVEHVTEGGFAGACSWLCNTQAVASAHFVNGQNGSYKQLVNLQDTAWCNGNSSATIGQALNPIVKSRPTANANSYTFSIENEGYSYKDNYGVLTPAQLESNIEICKKIVDYILTYNPKWRADRDHVIGHYAIVSKNKPSCPAPNYGEKFQWDQIINALNAYIDQKMGTKTPAISTTPTSTTTAPTDTVAATGIKVGSMVKVRNGALTYSGGKVAAFVYNNSYPVSSYSGDRVVLDKTGICTPFNVKDLTVIGSTPAAAPVATPAATATVKVGSMVKVKLGSVWYGTNGTNGAQVAAFVYNNTYRVDELNGDRALLGKGTLNSPINIKFLTVV